jgi:hypothetical protein
MKMEKVQVDMNRISDQQDKHSRCQTVLKQKIMHYSRQSAKDLLVEQKSFPHYCKDPEGLVGIDSQPER